MHTVTHRDAKTQFGRVLGAFVTHVDVGDVGFTGGGMSIGPATAERAAELMLHGTHPGVVSADRLTAAVRRG